MSVALQFKLTQTGQAAVWNANNTGTSLNLTHIQFGSGNRAPSGTETALLTPQQAVAIAAGFSVSATQIRMSAIFSGNQNYVVREVGVWAGDPAVAGSKLVGYWSQATGDLAMKSPGVDFIFSHDMTLDAAVPAGSLTILADNAQSAMLAMITAHEAAANPHNQYATKAAVQAQTYTAFTTVGAAPAFTLTAVPVIAAYAAGQRFRVKFGAAGNGADTLNVNALGAKSLKQYTPAGGKTAAVIAANQLVDVEYDGVDFVLLDPLGSGLQYVATPNIAATAALTASQVGRLLNLQGTPGTVTLPAANSLPAGATYHLWSQDNTWVVAKQAADFINTGNGSPTTLSLAKGETAILVTDGNNTWIAAGGSALNAFSNSFASSKAAPGYQKLPGGLIIQWGLVGTGAVATANVDITFPIAFPNACLGFASNIGVNSQNYNLATYRTDRQAVSFGDPTSTGVHGQAFNDNSVGDGRTVRWIAIGW